MPIQFEFSARWSGEGNGSHKLQGQSLLQKIALA